MHNLNIFRKLNWNVGVRSLSSKTQVAVEREVKRSHGRMSGWQIHSYSDNISDLQQSENLKRPYIRKPSEMLVKVLASSVNPIDVAMMNGYGSTLLNTMRGESSGIEFPLIFGRDFVGTVVHAGLDIKKNDYRVGDKIWGVVPVHRQGCHCEYVSIDQCYVSKKPQNLSDNDAAAVLYAGLTAWSGLYLTGQLGGIMGAFCSSGGGQGKKVLVLGAAGGVGSLAVQMLQAENVEVVATCSQDAVGIIQNLGVTKVVDYTSSDSDSILISESPYDIILDCAGKGSEYASSLPWTFDSYITFKSPLLKNFDSHGLVAGGLINARDIITSNISALNKGGNVKWGYFMPAQNGIHFLKKTAERSKLLPIIDSTFSYDALPDAYQKVQDGHLRGKVIVDFTKTG